MPFVEAGRYSFAMKGCKKRLIHGAHSVGALEISGHFQFQGPQPVDDNDGVPQWVADILDKHPDINQIALCKKDSGVVYSRMVED